MTTTKVELRRGNRGSILVEAVVSLMVVTTVMILNLELVRRIQLEVVFHHGAFLAVRERVLGGTDGESRRVVHRFWTSALGELGRWHALRAHHEERERRQELVRSASIRYLAFLPFKEAVISKHHFEVTEACKFSLAHY